jgi:hypothetical protein
VAPDLAGDVRTLQADVGQKAVVELAQLALGAGAGESRPSPNSSGPGLAPRPWLRMVSRPMEIVVISSCSFFAAAAVFIRACQNSVCAAQLLRRIYGPVQTHVNQSCFGGFDMRDFQHTSIQTRLTLSSCDKS